jgi:hypothetical protein
MRHGLPNDREAILRAIAITVVPEAAALDERGWRDLLGIVADAVAQRPAALQRQLRLFLAVLNVLPVARHGTVFTRADAATRTAVLHWLERAPIPRLRQGLWGVRTLVLMGYYARPEAQAEVGYRALPGGWSARAAAAAAPGTAV